MFEHEDLIMIDESLYNDGELSYDALRQTPTEFRVSSKKEEDKYEAEITAALKSMEHSFDLVSRRWTPAQAPAMVSMQLKQVRGPICAALDKSLTKIGDIIRGRAPFVSKRLGISEADYISQHYQDTAETAYWSIYNVLVNGDILNVPEEIKHTSGFEKHVMSTIEALVSEVANKALNGISYKDQDKRFTRSLFHKHVHNGSNRGIHGNWRTTRG